MADDRLQKALEHAHFRSTMETQQRMLRLRLDAESLHAENGGSFTANPELISFVNMLVQMGWEDATLQDARGNPVKVTNLVAFRDALLERWAEAMNSYATGWERIRKARSVAALVNGA